MEEHRNIGSESEQSERRTGRGLRETFRTGTPDEVREAAKEVAEKSIAAIAGALKGFTEKARGERVPEKTEQAIHRAGEAARKTLSGVAQEAEGLKQPLREAGGKLRETARDVKQTVASEVDETKSALRGEGGRAYGGLNSSPERGGEYGPPMGMGGSLLGESERRDEHEFPDIRNTPTRKPDKSLKGPNIHEELDED